MIRKRTKNPKQRTDQGDRSKPSKAVAKGMTESSEMEYQRDLTITHVKIYFSILLFIGIILLYALVVDEDSALLQTASIGILAYIASTALEAGLESLTGGIFDRIRSKAEYISSMMESRSELIASKADTVASSDNAEEWITGIGGFLAFLILLGIDLTVDLVEITGDISIGGLASLFVIIVASGVIHLDKTARTRMDQISQWVLTIGGGLTILYASLVWTWFGFPSPTESLRIAVAILVGGVFSIGIAILVWRRHQKKYLGWFLYFIILGALSILIGFGLIVEQLH